jgi:hypothetical protein
MSEFNFFADDAVIQYSQLSKLPGPDPHILDKFGRDRDVWAQGVDLMSLKPPPQSQRLSRSFMNHIVPVYHSIMYSNLVRVVYPAIVYFRQIFLTEPAGAEDWRSLLFGYGLLGSIKLNDWRHCHIRPLQDRFIRDLVWHNRGIFTTYAGHHYSIFR